MPSSFLIELKQELWTCFVFIRVEYEHINMFVLFEGNGSYLSKYKYFLGPFTQSIVLLVLNLFLEIYHISLIMTWHEKCSLEKVNS